MATLAQTLLDWAAHHKCRITDEQIADLTAVQLAIYGADIEAHNASFDADVDVAADDGLAIAARMQAFARVLAVVGWEVVSLDLDAETGIGQCDLKRYDGDRELIVQSFAVGPTLVTRHLLRVESFGRSEGDRFVRLRCRLPGQRTVCELIGREKVPSFAKGLSSALTYAIENPGQHQALASQRMRARLPAST